MNQTNPALKILITDESIMAFLKINSANIYYELHGEGDPIVLIAGLKADHTAWIPILNKLAINHRVLIFDNRGTGRTTDEPKHFSLENLAKDVIALIDELEIIKPHLVGHSMGGAIAQIIARQYPDDIRSVALCNTFLKFNESAKNGFRGILDLHKSGATQTEIIDCILPWGFSSKFLGSDKISAIRAARNENPYPQSAFDYERQFQALCDFDSRSWIDQIAIPVLVLGSDEDITATLSESEEIADRIKHSLFVSMPTGHASQIENPAAFVEKLQNFYCGFATFKNDNSSLIF